MCPETESCLSDESSSKLLQIILQYPKNFLGWIRKSSYNLWNCPFSSLWLTSGCTQNLFLLFALVLSRRAHTATDSTKSIPHKLTDSEQNVRTLAFLSPSVSTAKKYSAAAAKNRSGALTGIRECVWWGRHNTCKEDTSTKCLRNSHRFRTALPTPTSDLCWHWWRR